MSNSYRKIVRTAANYYGTYYPKRYDFAENIEFSAHVDDDGFVEVEDIYNLQELLDMAVEDGGIVKNADGTYKIKGKDYSYKDIEYDIAQEIEERADIDYFKIVKD